MSTGAKTVCHGVDRPRLQLQMKKIGIFPQNINDVTKLTLSKNQYIEVWLNFGCLLIPLSARLTVIEGRFCNQQSNPYKIHRKKNTGYFLLLSLNSSSLVLTDIHNLWPR